MGSKQKKRKSTALQRSFARACATIFDAALARYGFTRGAAVLQPTTCSQVYVAGERYVEIRANAEPRDFPHHCNVILGEGSLDWPERDWNSVALWRLIRARASTPKQAAASEYPLGGGDMNAPIPEDLRPVFETMREDLLRFAEDFLAGDTRAFRRVRAAQTQERAPYIIHRPAPGGSYIASVDPTTAALKQRFSREDVG